MKASVVLLLVAAGSAPVISGVGIDWLHMDDVKGVLAGRNITDVANEVAKREFTPDVRLALVNESVVTDLHDDYGGAVHPSEGNEYRAVGLSVTNDGRLDVAVHTYHFTAFLDGGHKVRAEVGLSTKFEVTQLSTGQTALGSVVFQVPPGEPIARILWQGELANSTLYVRDAPPAQGAPDVAAPAQEPTSGPLRLTLVGQSDASTARTASGDEIAAPDGQVFRTVRLHVESASSETLQLRTTQFEALDAAQQEYPATAGLAQHIDQSLAPGASLDGSVTFVMPADDSIATLAWQQS